MLGMYLCLYEYVHMSTGVSGVQKRHLIHRSGELQEVVSHLTWVLGTELGSSGRAASAFNH